MKYMLSAYNWQPVIYISAILADIINYTFLKGSRTQFKTAVICPVCKSGYKKQVNNYRPIALISNLSKIFGKIVFIRRYSFAMQHKLINSTQFGFLEKKGSEEAIAMLSKFIYENLGASNPTIVTFLDYYKAIAISYYQNFTIWE